MVVMWMTFKTLLADICLLGAYESPLSLLDTVGHGLIRSGSNQNMDQSKLGGETERSWARGRQPGRGLGVGLLPTEANLPTFISSNPSGLGGRGTEPEMNPAAGGPGQLDSGCANTITGAGARTLICFRYEVVSLGI
ncbi:hypothetical protein EYF80_041259 [Liparis tanakae]|uniref:Uncharacterized protein n=1 Tax=Liparis tanakae TaxID=230148 RepID=A0A4Z2G6N3_9TELE|nr:hypothetical protein EYF80_041259 [Liparis tanakae]